MNTMTREQTFDVINSERDYQDKLTGGERKSVASELVLLRAYLRRAETEFTITFNDPNEQPTMVMIRKLAGICVRAIETYGAPLRP